MEPTYILVALIVITAAIVWIFLAVERKRTAAWKTIADRLGARFTPKGSNDFTGFGFQLFNLGNSRKMKNHLKWESEGVTVNLADYQYTVRRYNGRNNTSKTYKQTICILEKEGLELPRTFMRRQIALLDWMGNKFGAQDINFDEDPEFSKAFVLKGDENRTPQIMTPDLRRQLLQNKKAFKTLEMNGSALMVNFGKRRKPEEYADLVGFAMPIYYMVSSSSTNPW